MLCVGKFKRFTTSVLVQISVFVKICGKKFDLLIGVNLSIDLILKYAMTSHQLAYLLIQLPYFIEYNAHTSIVRT